MDRYTIKLSMGKLRFIFLAIIFILTAFFFSYLLIPTPVENLQVRGQYYGDYIWPVAVFLHSVLGATGWSLFGFFMNFWFIYALPIFVVAQGILKIPIPFTPRPLIEPVPELVTWQWMVLLLVVLTYNIILLWCMPIVAGLVTIFIKGIQSAHIGEETIESGRSGAQRTGLERET